ncbi:hypothetical protein GCM10009646_79050 [Streptomyces aureus]
MMATTQRNTKVSEQTVTDLSAKIGFVVGVDGEQCVHVHYPAADVVEVTPVGEDYEVGDYITNEAERVQDLGDRPLEHWMAYVASERGWTTTTHRAPDNWNGGGA